MTESFELGRRNAAFDELRRDKVGNWTFDVCLFSHGCYEVKNPGSESPVLVRKGFRLRFQPGGLTGRRVEPTARREGCAWGPRDSGKMEYWESKADIGLILHSDPCRSFKNRSHSAKRWSSVFQQSSVPSFHGIWLRHSQSSLT